MKHLIARKRDGEALSSPEIHALITAYTAGEIPDYQMSAFLMAVLWRGMSDDETYWLTRAMIGSGRTLSYADCGPTADKHSTGGVGDKVSLALAPLAACAGLRVPMLSGRSLGHTGGTLDKLESIPGFTTSLDAGAFERVLREVGCVMGGQSAELAPADGKMYALRDATATIESHPLIVSSILSKKIAAGPDVLVLDVKVGRGAFMDDLSTAEALARLLVGIGSRFGKKIVAFLTDMNVPLGRAVGNAIEVREALALLRGQEVASDFRELTLLLTATMLVGAGRDRDLEAARARLEDIVASGEGYRRFCRMVEAQGGDPQAVERDELPRAAAALAVSAPRRGVVADIDARAIAELVIELGGGRREMTDRIDPAVGVWLDRRPGEAVETGDPLMTLHLPPWAIGAGGFVERARAAYRVDDRGSERRLIHRVVGAAGSFDWGGWKTTLPFDRTV